VSHSLSQTIKTGLTLQKDQTQTRIIWRRVVLALDPVLIIPVLPLLPAKLKYRKIISVDCKGFPIFAITLRVKPLIALKHPSHELPPQNRDQGLRLLLHHPLQKLRTLVRK